MDKQTSTPRVLNGQIELPSNIKPFTPARIVVELEDISRADAPSELVASLQIMHGTLQAGTQIPFTLEIPAGALNERNSYSLRVHIDSNGSGKIDPGDYITMQSFPVLTRGYGNEARVIVRQVPG